MAKWNWSFLVIVSSDCRFFPLFYLKGREIDTSRSSTTCFNFQMPTGDRAGQADGRRLEFSPAAGTKCLSHHCFPECFASAGSWLEEKDLGHKPGIPIWDARIPRGNLPVMPNTHPQILDSHFQHNTVHISNNNFKTYDFTIVLNPTIF